MSELVLVRHGQAASFSDDPDRLTGLGARQAEALARHWLARDVAFDEAHSGTLRRQVETERVVARVYAEAGRPWPEPVRHSGWNEYDSNGVLGRLAPALAERDPAFRALVEDFDRHRDRPDVNRYFQRMFERLTEGWLAGEIEADGVESYAAFAARVSEARERVFAGPGSRRVAVFTSGGAIGQCVRLVLDAPSAALLKLNWRIQNTSLTEFTFSRDRCSLDSFNAIPHLDDRTLRSYR